MNKILSLLLALITIITSLITNDLTYLTYLIFLLVPFIIKIDSSIVFIYYTYTFLSFFLGMVGGLYQSTTWYDTFSHFLWGIVVSIFGLYILKLLKIETNLFFEIIFIFTISLAASATWEIFEFMCDRLLDSDMQRKLTGVYDTMKDIISATIGSILFVIIYIIDYNKRGIILKLKSRW